LHDGTQDFGFSKCATAWRGPRLATANERPANISSRALVAYRDQVFAGNKFGAVVRHEASTTRKPAGRATIFHDVRKAEAAHG